MERLHPSEQHYFVIPPFCRSIPDSHHRHGTQLSHPNEDPHTSGRAGGERAEVMPSHPDATCEPSLESLRQRSLRATAGNRFRQTR